MGKRLYVGGLPYAFDDAELEKLFATMGSVAYAKIIMDRMSGKSKGFGFVEMETEEAAQRAIRELHGTQQQNRTITVNEARPQQKGGGGFDRDKGGFRKPKRGGGGGWGNGGSSRYGDR